MTYEEAFSWVRSACQGDETTLEAFEVWCREVQRLRSICEEAKNILEKAGEDETFVTNDEIEKWLTRFDQEAQDEGEK